MWPVLAMDADIYMFLWYALCHIILNGIGRRAGLCSVDSFRNLSGRLFVSTTNRAVVYTHDNNYENTLFESVLLMWIILLD